MSITPTDEQYKAISLIEYWFFNNPKAPFVLGGYAGVGKSTIIPFIIDQLKLGDYQVRFCAFTGKAANVLRNKGLCASTIHSLLYIPYEDASGKLKFKQQPTLSPDICLIVVDEASCVDTSLKSDLESYGIPVLYIGDCFQLPPVSKDQTNIMSNPNFILTEIHRQAADNPIIRLAHMIRKGEYIKYGSYDGLVLKVRANNMNDDWLLKSSQVICGKNTTRHNLNKKIRRLKGIDVNHPIIGDKMICLKNNNENGLINGMLGTCNEFNLKKWSMSFENDNEEIWNNLDIEPKIFEQDTDFKYSKFIEMFDYGYVITCHKAQGSQFEKGLIMNEPLGFDSEIRRRWEYTAITRYEKKVIIVD